MSLFPKLTFYERFAEDNINNIERLTYTVIWA